MSRISIGNLAWILAAFGAFVSNTGSAIADPTTPLIGAGTGQIVHQIDPTPENPVGVQYYLFQGNVTRMGKVSGFGMTRFSPIGEVLPGSFFIATAADGSTIMGFYSGSFAPIPNTNNFRFDVQVDWGAGTNRLAGLTGSSETIAVVNGLTGAFTWKHDGVWNK